MKTYILSKKIENRLLCNQLCIEGALMLIKREKKFNIKTRFCLHLKFSYHSSAGILKLHCLHLKQQWKHFSAFKRQELQQCLHLFDQDCFHTRFLKFMWC